MAAARSILAPRPPAPPQAFIPRHFSSPNRPTVPACGYTRLLYMYLTDLTTIIIDFMIHLPLAYVSVILFLYV